MTFPKNVSECEALVQQAQENIKKMSTLMQEEQETELPMEKLRELDLAYYRAAKVTNTLEIIKMVHPYKKLREKAQQELLSLGEDIKKCTSDPRLYQLMKDCRNAAGDSEGLDAEDEYYLTREMTQMEVNGVALEQEQRDKLQEINTELEKIGHEFVVNAQNTEVVLIITEEQLDESGLELKRFGICESIDKSAGVPVILTFPNYMYIIENSASQEVRRECYRLQNQVALESNNALMDRYLSLHAEKAALLGYENSAEQQLVTESAGDTARLDRFYENIYCGLADKCVAEMELLKSTYNLESLELWDVPYYINKYRKEHENLDRNAFRKYFRTEHAISKMLEIYGGFFGLHFEEERFDMGLWHEDVKAYRVSTRGKDGCKSEFLGHILTDLFPREGKFGHMCMMRVGSHNEASNDAALAVVIGNLGKKHMTPESIVTFFHEFGHAIHHVLGHAKWASASGNAVLTDFVEFPSQLLEEWMWDADVLQFIASKEIPSDVLDAFIASRKTFMAQEMQRQLMLGYTAYKYFRDTCNSMESRREVWKELMAMCLPNVNYDVSVDMTTRFFHLCHYGCKYYSYLWSKCIAIEVFQKIKSENASLLQATAGKYMDLLTMGGGLEPISQMEKYLGHKLEFNGIVDYVNSINTKSDTLVVLS